MKLEDLMPDELEELQDAGVLTHAGSQMLSPRTTAPRELEFRRGDNHSDPRARRIEARKRRAIER